MGSNFISLPQSRVDKLPSSLTKRVTKRIRHKEMDWIQVYCINCGSATGGLVPENWCTFASYICLPCVEKLGPVPGTYMEPDKVFWQKVHDVQIEEFGRVLTAPEIEEALKDSDNVLSKLAKERNK